MSRMKQAELEAAVRLAASQLNETLNYMAESEDMRPLPYLVGSWEYLPNYDVFVWQLRGDFELFLELSVSRTGRISSANMIGGSGAHTFSLKVRESVVDKLRELMMELPREMWDWDSMIVESFKKDK